MEVKFNDVSNNDLFKNLNIELNEENINVIVGKNSSGKTSFLNLIFGTNLEFQGNIVINKKNINSKTTKKDLINIRKNIFYLPQEYSLQLFNENILKDIKYQLSDFDNTKLEELLKLFDLSLDILQKTYFELSDGEKKKILLIIMLMSKKDIILLDDPTSGLDNKSVLSLIKLLKKEKRNGKTIIISSQDSEFIFGVAEKIYLLDNKKILEFNNKYEFFENKKNLNKCKIVMPKVLEFRQNVLEIKGKKLMYRDSLNDLIKDIYRDVK